MQANYKAAGLIGNLIGVIEAGLLYSFSIGLPFLIVGFVCLVAGLFLLLPGISRMFIAARQNVPAKPIKTDLIEETVVERQDLNYDLTQQTDSRPHTACLIARGKCKSHQD